jgi:hypothetical protein
MCSAAIMLEAERTRGWPRRHAPSRVAAPQLIRPDRYRNVYTHEEDALMKRIIGVLAGTMAIGLSITGVAAAAATPTVHTRGATRITTTTAVVHGLVNPHGVTTDYTFNYGPTPSYGLATVARSAGSGRHAVGVVDKLTGLSPGTVYHYQIVGVSAAGTATGADGTFKTAGTPPSAVQTGPADAVYKEQATLTGAVNPNGAQTTWVIQYGTTPNYGLQTFPQVLPAGSAAVPVGVTINGLAPAKLFHYRVVAYHGATVTYGADATFFTQPVHPPSAGLHTRTRPGADASKPYTFTTSGSLNGGRYIPAAQRCSGTVGIRYYNGKRQLAYVVAGVGSDCRFSGHVAFNKTGGHGRVHLRVTISYRGNGYLAAQHKTNHVTVGR